MPATDRPAGHLDLQEAAARIGVHPDHLLRMIRLGQVKLTPRERPAWRARRKFWFVEADVNRVANARRVLNS